MKDELLERAREFVATQADGNPDEMELIAWYAKRFATEVTATQTARIAELEGALTVARKDIIEWAKFAPDTPAIAQNLFADLVTIDEALNPDRVDKEVE